jgi:hypothetical protein
MTHDISFNGENTISFGNIFSKNNLQNIRVKGLVIDADKFTHRYYDEKNLHYEIMFKLILRTASLDTDLIHKLVYISDTTHSVWWPRFFRRFILEEFAE